MKFYAIVQYQMAGIHAGIQAAHCLHEMYERYVGPPDKASHTLHEWAQKHKTIVILNGGGSGYLREMFHDIIDPCATGLHLPCAKFHESRMAADGMLTCVGIVVPKSVYEYDPNRRWAHGKTWDDQQYLAVNKLKDLIDGMRSQR